MWIYLVIFVFVLYYFCSKKEKMTSIKLVNYYAPWCGYSKSLLPVWAKLEKQYENNPNVMIKKVDCDKHSDEALKNNVTGYPTIILFKNNKKVKYQGDRSLYDLSSFVKRHQI